MKYEIAMLKSEVGGSRLGQLSYEHLQELYPEQCRVDTYENIDSFCEALQGGRSYQAVLLETEQQQRIYNSGKDKRDILRLHYIFVSKGRAGI